MADKYDNFESLRLREKAGVHYRILVQDRSTPVVIVAPHGGSIEPGTSELTQAIAGENLSFYAFEGTKTSDNSVLHITSTRFDEPLCVALVGRADTAIAIHGRGKEEKAVYLGGRNEALASRLGASLKEHGFKVLTDDEPEFRGLSPRNICNRVVSGKGVQLEITRGLRQTMFASLDEKGRKEPTDIFARFVTAIRSAL